MKDSTGNIYYFTYYFTYNSDSGIKKGKVKALSLEIAKIRAKKLIGEGEGTSLRRIWQRRE